MHKDKYESDNQLPLNTPLALDTYHLDHSPESLIQAPGRLTLVIFGRRKKSYRFRDRYNIGTACLLAKALYLAYTPFVTH